jgi:hypothetical protein
VILFVVEIEITKYARIYFTLYIIYKKVSQSESRYTQKYISSIKKANRITVRFLVQYDFLAFGNNAVATAVFSDVQPVVRNVYRLVGVHSGMRFVNAEG